MRHVRYARRRRTLPNVRRTEVRTFVTWCAQQTARIKTDLDAFEQQFARTQLLVESRYGWWSKVRMRAQQSEFYYSGIA